MYICESIIPTTFSIQFLVLFNKKIWAINSFINFGKREECYRTCKNKRSEFCGVTVVLKVWPETRHSDTLYIVISINEVTLRKKLKWLNILIQPINQYVENILSDSLSAIKN
jgi:hypothetical protein